MRDDPRHIIGLVGEGRLYQAVCAQLEQSYQLIGYDITQAPSPRCPLLVLVEDHWQPQRQALVNRFSLKHAIPWLRVSIEFGTGMLGPCVFPGESGCVTCVETRRITATIEDAAEIRALRKHIVQKGLEGDPSWLTAFGVEVLTSLIVQEVAACLTSPCTARTRNALLEVQLDNLQVKQRLFLPDPHCPDCGHLPEDTFDAARVTLQSRPKLAPFQYRIRSLTTELDTLHQQYIDEQTGIIHRVGRDNSNLYANVGARIGLYGGLRTEEGVGRSLSYAASQGSAIAEALERLGGMRPGGRRTTIRACYNQLNGQALDPTTLGLHSPEQYALPAYPYTPYSHDSIYNWVWGYSFQRQQPVLVPERYVYYGLRRQDSPDHPFVYEISNGCALGSCLEEALLYGILEVAERDAFLLTWYARLRVPQIDPFSATDPAIGLLIERIEYMTGYSIFAFNMTLNSALPCFLVMGIDEQQRRGYPRALCAAGSHMHPEKALANAIHELAPTAKYMPVTYQKEREQAYRMLHDSFAVTEMNNHRLLYCLPEAFDRLDFLAFSRPQQTFRDAFSDFYRRKAQTDLLYDLNEIITLYLAQGLDIIVVDQTTPEHTAGKFRCVKVIIPGTLPMTFGHKFRRVTGLERLYQLPYTLGYYPQPLTEANINPYPHPFP